MHQISQQFRVLQKPINKIPFRYQFINSESIDRKKSQQNFKLPNIYLKSKSHIKQIILLSDKPKIIKQISKQLTFQNKKLSCISNYVFQKISEQTKPLAYNSIIYQTQIVQLNKVFQCIGLSLKAKDVLVLQGKLSETTYTLFTNYPRHPLTICCKSPILIKHINFLTPFYQNSLHKLPNQQKKYIKNMIIISCLQCGEDKIKIKKQDKQEQKSNLSQFEQKKKLLQYSKLIASGKFKKNFIRDESLNVIGNQNKSISSINHHNQFHIENKYKQQKMDQSQNILQKLKTQQISLDLIKKRSNRYPQRLHLLSGKSPGTQRYNQNSNFYKV